MRSETPADAPMHQGPMLLPDTMMIDAGVAVSHVSRVP